MVEGRLGFRAWGERGDARRKREGDDNNRERGIEEGAIALFLLD